MPEFFTTAELASRNRGFRRISEQCTIVLLSSVDAQKDLAKFAPASTNASRVLHFVSGFAGGNTDVVPLGVLQFRYSIVGPYFHLPNQFWIHKNHRVVIDALALLKARGYRVLVLCTGHTRDYRWPNYFDELMRYAKEQNVTDYFRVVGLIPYEDMTSLMKHSIAIINPSLFEGWSTTVEEAKSLRLNMVLSNIPVHREQNPTGGVFFDPLSPVSLADALEEVMKCNPVNIAARAKAQTNISLVEKFADFGIKYQTFALEAFLLNSKT
ncbi:MAG: glycosyltransferase [Glaciimonas sp.]|nr:glycosyltransferase [Glaciimonas sp.]